MTRHPTKKHLEEATDHLVEVGPEGAHPSPIVLTLDLGGRQGVYLAPDRLEIGRDTDLASLL
jgi:hypothetical protein